MANKLIFWTLLWVILSPIAWSQTLYFPPLVGDEWATVSTESQGWCEEPLEALHDFLEEYDTKAFIVLQDGRIALEWYFGTFTRDSVWYWASAGKSLTSTLVGIAQEEGLLSIEDPTSQYLGNGWTSLTPAQEQAITIRHQLTMTTGLDDTEGDPDCTDPNCLTYIAPPGTRWAYHNAPYTLLDPVLEAAAGTSLNQFYNSRIGTRIGAPGLYIPVGYNRVFFSRPRSAARFGLLILAQGQWNGNSILGDMDYLTAMHTPSQALNPSYGYLWWLNGQSSYMLPGLQLSLPGVLVPSAPADAFAALGKNDQKIYVVPSQGRVIVRMGETSGISPLALSDFDEQMWQHLNALVCTNSTNEIPEMDAKMTITPNPTQGQIRIATDVPVARVMVTNAAGQLVTSGVQPTIDMTMLPTGIYFVRVWLANGQMVVRKVYR
ncbi:MAG: serine hydrolase [Saprospiraceae bacterium]